jgi:hypothetical protein
MAIDGITEQKPIYFFVRYLANREILRYNNFPSISIILQLEILLKISEC